MPEEKKNLTEEEKKLLETVPAWKPDKDEDETVKYIYERYKKMKKARTGGGNSDFNFEDEWTNAEKLFFEKKPARKQGDYRSDYHSPVVRATIQTILSETVERDSTPYFKPVEDTDEPKADLMEACVKFSNDKTNYFWERYKTDEEFLIYGTGVMEEYYNLKERKNNADVGSRNHSVWNMYFDESAQEVGVARDCIRREIIPQDTFDDFYGKYENSKYVMAGNASTERYEYYQPPQTLKAEEIEVIHYYNQLKDRYNICANGILLNKFDNPIPFNHKKLPFVVYFDIHRPHQIFGIGEPELLTDIVEEINTLRRMKLDRQHMAIHKMFITSSGAEIDEDDLIPRPHGLIEVEGDIGQILPLEYGDIPASYLQSENEAKDDAAAASGVDRRLEGLAKPDETATEVASRKETAIKRIRMKLVLAEKVGMKRQFEMRVSNIQQFWSTPIVEQIAGKKKTAKAHYRTVRMENKIYAPDENKIYPKKGYHFFEATKDLLDVKVDVYVEPDSTLPVTQALEQQRFDLLFDRIINLPPNMMPDSGKVKFLAKYLKIHKLDPDLYDIGGDTYKTPEEEQVYMEDMAREETQRMIKGEVLPPTPNATPEHTNIHGDLLQQQPVDPQIEKVITAHMQGEVKMQQDMQQGAVPAGMQPGGMEGQPTPTPTQPGNTPPTPIE